MAPGRGRQPSIDRSEEYDKFIAEVAAYHEKRGTTFEREPRIAKRHIDLLRLYKMVCDAGGYDVVSDPARFKMAWRKFATDFSPSAASNPGFPFLLKSVYYKNLAAYEISTLHGKEPPPREILEDITAKGGDLLTRTLENFAPRANVPKEASPMANGAAEQDDNHDAPENNGASEDLTMEDRPDSSNGRITRGLRHAPPQRVLFQPDTGSPRSARNTAAANSGSPTPMSLPPHQQSPQPPRSSSQPRTLPLVNGRASPSLGNTVTVAGYELKSQIPSAVKPVPTPSNNPEYFRQLKERTLAKLRLTTSTGVPRGVMLPGTGYPGPGIYTRALLALQSQLPDEVEYALHHLVKISHERGDKYRFAEFSGLAEALMKTILKVTPIFYEGQWEVSYLDQGPGPWNQLDGCRGTFDLLDRISGMRLRDIAEDELRSQTVSKALARINEATLVMRNMAMLDDNAAYLANIELIQDVLTIVLNLPDVPVTQEMIQYALEMTEQITKFLILDAKNPMYRSIIKKVDSQDRGVIISSLRSLSRISLLMETVPNRLQGIPHYVLQNIEAWILADDEELRSACLDFLYQFTAIKENVEILLRTISTDSLVSQLVRLLMHNATTDDRGEKPKPPEPFGPMPHGPPKLMASLVQHLLGYGEPERSSQWLKSCYVEDPPAEVTQVALWQAYQNSFQEAAGNRSTLSAKDFITNVSATFPTAVAHVLPGPRYIIRGVRPRDAAVDQRGRPYTRCLWRSAKNGRECGEYGMRGDGKGLWDHILAEHLYIPRDVDGNFYLPDGEDSDDDMDLGNDNAEKPPPVYNCTWGGCRHFPNGGSTNFALVAAHIKTHLPDNSKYAAHRAKHNKINDAADNVPKTRSFISTAVDERGHPIGLPLTSVLVLRNLARQLARIEAPRNVEEDENWVGIMFRPVRDQLMYVFAHNWPLREYLASLMDLIDTGMDQPR